jgi:hypothetical protein
MATASARAESGRIRRLRQTLASSLPDCQRTLLYDPHSLTLRPGNPKRFHGDPSLRSRNREWHAGRSSRTGGTNPDIVIGERRVRDRYLHGGHVTAQAIAFGIDRAGRLPCGFAGVGRRIRCRTRMALETFRFMNGGCLGDAAVRIVAGPAIELASALGVTPAPGQA